MTDHHATPETPGTFTGFLKTDLAAGMILTAAAALGIWAKNSPFAPLYDQFLHTELGFDLGIWAKTEPVYVWIKEGLMTIFFLLVGLEIKREAMVGVLADPRKLALPGIAALGGMILPAIVFLATTHLLHGSGNDFRGWSIPVATDIAFALAALALAGKSVPIGLRVFLLALAVIDDLGAIMLIAVIYSAKLNPVMLGAGAGILVLLWGLNRLRVSNLGVYLGLGIVLWAVTVQSGMNGTLAGVALAMTIPMKTHDRDHPPLEDLEHFLKPWVAFLILPLFAFAFAGFSLQGLSAQQLLQPVTMGIGLGLLIGKPLGIALFSFLAVTLGLGRLPDGVNWTKVIGVGFVAGIGFTMSLFVGALAFKDVEGAHYAEAVRLGVISGSILAVAIGVTILRMTGKVPSRPINPSAVPPI